MGQPPEPEWPPRFTWAWNGILLRIAAMYQNDDPGGYELLALVQEFLEERGPSANDFVHWARGREIAHSKEDTDG